MHNATDDEQRSLAFYWYAPRRFESETCKFYSNFDIRICCFCCLDFKIHKVLSRFSPFRHSKGIKSRLQVARTLRRSPSTLHDLWYRHQQTGTVRDRPRRSRSRVTTPAQDRYIRLSHLRNRRSNANDTARNTIGTHGRQISGRLCGTGLKITVCGQEHHM